MADELKSMFRAGGPGGELTQEEMEEKIKYDFELQRRRELNKKHSKKIFFKLF